MSCRYPLASILSTTSFAKSRMNVGCQHSSTVEVREVKGVRYRQNRESEVAANPLRAEASLQLLQQATVLQAWPD
eukprot:m.277944 g.277944  ORF g.277944 m.277944 type:complete len:75 (-) comp17715_c0_seq2:1515-1739(-)